MCAHRHSFLWVISLECLQCLLLQWAALICHHFNLLGICSPAVVWSASMLKPVSSWRRRPTHCGLWWTKHSATDELIDCIYSKPCSPLAYMQVPSLSNKFLSALNILASWPYREIKPHQVSGYLAYNLGSCWPLATVGGTQAAAVWFAACMRIVARTQYTVKIHTRAHLLWKMCVLTCITQYDSTYIIVIVVKITMHRVTRAVQAQCSTIVRKPQDDTKYE